MNTPNKITLSRLVLIPLIIFFYMATFIPGGKFIAAGLFILACVTDFLDGYIARKYNQVTDLGKFFDAIADKVLTMTGMILIIAVPGYAVIDQPVEFVAVCMIVMLAREFIISALRQIAGAKGKVLAAEWSGKIKATLQYITISLYLIFAGFIQDTTVLFGDNASVARMVINIILLVLLSVTTVLTVYSGLGYIIKNRHVFSTKDEKAKMVEVKDEKVEVREEVVKTEEKTSKPASKTETKSKNAKTKTQTKNKKA